MPPDQRIEQEIQFKKRARRRLVGAIALVLLMVTVLPMVLDDRVAKSPQQEIAISIPSQDGTEFTSKVVPVGPIMPEPVIVPEAQPEKAQIKEPALVKVPPSEVVETIKPAKPIVKPAQVVAPKPETPKATPAGKSSEQNSSANIGLYTVQIGVFSDAANVKNLQQKLKTLGYKSYAEMIDTPKGKKIRLRAGPFSNREQAESALVTIKDGGLSGLVVLNK